MYARQGYVSGQEFFSGYVMVIGVSLICAIVGLVLSVAALWKTPRPRPLERKWEPIAFLLVPACWYFLYGHIYVWLTGRP